MINECVQNFLNKTHTSSADQHSDSSDFGKPSKYFRVSAKVAINTTKAKNKGRQLIKHHTDLCNAHVSTQYCISSENNVLVNENMFKSVERRSWKQYEMKENKSSNYFSSNYCETPKNHYIKRSHGNIDIIRDSNTINQKPCKPEIIVSNSTKTDHSNSSSSNNKNNNFTNGCSKYKFEICSSQLDSNAGNGRRKRYDKMFWYRKMLKRVGNKDDFYTISPIYVIEKNGHSKKNLPDQVDNSTQNVSAYCSSSCGISFAESEKEIFKRSYRILSSTVSKLHDIPTNSIPKVSNNNSSNDTKNMPPMYESKSISTDLKIANKLTSSSSAFWSFLSDKVHRKCGDKKEYKNKFPCDISYHQRIFENNESVVGKRKLNIEAPSSNNNEHIHEKNQTEFIKIDKECQGNGSAKLEILSDQQSTEISKIKSEGKHETIAKALAEKYNGEILCIHNPPCVLINGCLNISPSNAGHSQFWPVMTKRRTAFGRKNKKVRVSKVNKYDKSSQCRPSFSKVEECLPEFNTDHVQYKRSPCQVYQCRGGKGFKINNEPKSASLNLLKGTYSSSEQNVNCTKIPLCSKVYVVVNANENSNARAVCPHKPACLMIPKCLARMITNNYIRVNTVPDCTHVPYCEKIPACFGKTVVDAAKSKHSKSSCHIV